MFGMHGPELYLLFIIFIGIPIVILLNYLTKEKKELLHFGFPFLKTLNNGTIIRIILSILIKLIGFGIILFTIGFSIYTVVMAIENHITTSSIIMLLFAIIILLIFSILALQVQLYHSEEIKNLPESPFTITPIISIFFRMTGEIYALLTFTAGIIMFLVTLFSSSGAMEYLPFSGLFPRSLFGIFNKFGSGAIIASVGILIGAFFSALFILMGSYLISELLVVITDIAVNIRFLLNHENNKKFTLPLTYLQTTNTEYIQRCPSCKNNIKLEDIFCENCGTKLK